VFKDEAWFRGVTEPVADPEDRVEHIDRSLDWWYVDDLAEHYCRQVGADELFAEHSSRRIFVPDPRGSGEGVLRWLGSIGEARES
jgi:hypothetical protein